MGTRSDLSSATKLFLDWNNLTDAVIQPLLTNDLPEATHISLKGNPITADALKKMTNKKYEELLLFDLSRTYIGDEGIRTLINNSFPILQVLRLADVDLTRKGLLLLEKLDAPQLVAIDISCNGLAVDDLAKFNPRKLPSLSKIVIYPTMYSEDLERLSIKYNRFKEEEEPLIVIDTDIIYLND